MDVYLPLRGSTYIHPLFSESNHISGEAGRRKIQISMLNVDPLVYFIIIFKILQINNIKKPSQRNIVTLYFLGSTVFCPRI